MRTNKFIPFLIALFIHSIPLSYLAFRKSLSTQISQSFPSSTAAHGIDLSGFSLAHRNSKGIEKSKIKPTESVGLGSKINADTTSKAASSSSSSSVIQGIANGVSSETFRGVVFVQVKEPQYPPIARQKGLEGKVKAKAFYNADGVVTKVDITESSGVKMLDEAVKTAVNEWRLSKGSAGSFEKSFEFKLKN